MNRTAQNLRVYFLPLLMMALGAAPAITQEILVPDPGLNTAIRETLQKPAGPLTQQDLLSLTNLDASRRSVSRLAGLEAARNLVGLDLQVNRLTNFSFPPELTSLMSLNLSSNPLTNCFIPNGLTNLSSLSVEACGLTNFSLPAGLTQLNTLALANNQLARLEISSNLTSLIFVDLSFNSFTELPFPRGLTNLETLVLSGNSLTNFSVPTALTALVTLHLDQNNLTSFTLPPGMTNLIALNLFFNQLTNINLPGDLRKLASLDLDGNRFTSMNLPATLTRLVNLHLRSNQLTNFSLPDSLTTLSFLDLGENHLSKVSLPTSLNHLTFLRISGNEELKSLTLPMGMTNLSGLFLRFNQLTNLTLPPDLNQLVQIDVLGNQLTSFTLPPGLTNLVSLFLDGNQLTQLTLPPDMVHLSSLVLGSNPLTTLVLSEPQAATNSETVNFLISKGVSVFTYPLTVELLRPRKFLGDFVFGIKGPPGNYTVLGSSNLVVWGVLGVANNQLGSISFHDVTVGLTPLRYYRVVRQTPPTNMVFIPPNTFTMGSPIGEQDRSSNEGPQTTVTLSRGFWIGKYEVTQGEYLSVTGTNPSQFPGDLNRPVSSVSWPDATNYCWILTQRELAAGHIPAGSQYRLPTEAEWECAARAGTTTRFSYGDDPDYAGLPNHAWQALENGLTVHPVGQKLPNPWGLYDTAGNVFEWCQDWLGPLPGGLLIDPQGPPSNPIGWKIMRGGAFDFGGAGLPIGESHVLRQPPGAH